MAVFGVPTLTFRWHGQLQLVALSCFPWMISRSRAATLVDAFVLRCIWLWSDWFPHLHRACCDVVLYRLFLCVRPVPRCLPLLTVVTKNYDMSLEWIGYSRKDFTFPSDQVPVLSYHILSYSVVLLVLLELLVVSQLVRGSSKDVVGAQVVLCVA